MPLLCNASLKEFESLVCLWHDVKLRKTQLEVRSLHATWSGDLWGHRVIVFFRKCVKLLAEQLWQIWRRYAPPFFAIWEKPYGGVEINPPAGARVDVEVAPAAHTDDGPNAVPFLAHRILEAYLRSDFQGWQGL